MLYEEFVNKRQDEFNNFKGIGFAYSNKQFNDLLDKLNTTPDNLCSIGHGGYILKNRYKDFIDMLIKNDNELDELMKDYDFCLSALKFELLNHEYGITYDNTSALEALNLTSEDLINNETVSRAYKEARAYAIENTYF